MPLTTLEATDLLRFADLIAERIGSAEASLSKSSGFEREKAWLAAAAELLDAARAPGKGLVDQARMLPELGELREEMAGTIQNAWVDSLEKLLAGITFHVSSRAPIIEALFPHQKFPPLRRCPFEVAAKYQADFEKRAKSGYVNRMLSGDEFAFAVPVVEQIRKAWADYQSCFSDEGMPEEQAVPVREALIAAASGLELPLRQAKLLAEAALAPIEGAFEDSGIGAKPKKRSARMAQTETIAVDTEEPQPGPEPEPVPEPVPAESEAESVAEVVAESAVAEAAPDAAAEKPAKKKRAPKTPPPETPPAS